HFRPNLGAPDLRRTPNSEPPPALSGSGSGAPAPGFPGCFGGRVVCPRAIEPFKPPSRCPPCDVGRIPGGPGDRGPGGPGPRGDPAHSSVPRPVGQGADGARGAGRIARAVAEASLGPGPRCGQRRPRRVSLGPSRHRPLPAVLSVGAPGSAREGRALAGPGDPSRARDPVRRTPLPSGYVGGIPR